MKNKLDWFDDDWKWDVLPTRMLYELLLSPAYRWPWKVKIVCSYRWGLSFHSGHDSEPPWSVSTSSSATTVVKD